MKSKAILVSLLIVFAVLAVASFASASDLAVNNLRMSIKGADNVASDVVEADAGETIPIQIVFTAGEDASDVRVKTSISGYRDDITASTGRFDIIDGTTYSKLLSLKVPSDIDPAEDYTLTLSIETKTERFEQDFTLKLQRESYNLDILSVEAARSIQAGSNLAVNVVLKNIGSHRTDDAYVTVRIPALDVEKRAYFGDLTPTDGSDYTLELDQNGQIVPVMVHQSSSNSDTVERTMFLAIPSDAKAGVYTLEVESTTADATSKTTKSIVIAGSEQKSDVLTAMTSKDIQAGETVTYDLVIINSGDKIAVYNIVPENAQNLIVSVDEPIITVPADSSRTVKVTVTAGNVMGTFNFAVNVNSQDMLVKRVNFTANIGKKSFSNNVMVLTVVLAIVFVVLLIVLIVLLTRKPEKSEELGESYY